MTESTKNWHRQGGVDPGDMAEYLGFDLWGHTPQGDLRVAPKGVEQPTAAMTYDELEAEFLSKFKVVPAGGPRGAGYVKVVPKTSLGENPSAKKRRWGVLAEGVEYVMDRNDFFRGYVEAALWSSIDDKDVPLDKNYGPQDIAPETIEEMFADANRFRDENWNDIVKGMRSVKRAGHDFWLTRNGHGAGFWDGDWPEPQATRLTDAAHAYGEVWLYVGDDGLIYSG